MKLTLTGYAMALTALVVAIGLYNEMMAAQVITLCAAACN